MTTKEIIKLPAGTDILVDDIKGKLVFQDIPEDFEIAQKLSIKFLEDYYYYDYANILETVDDKEINDTLVALVEENRFEEMKEFNLTEKLIYYFTQFRNEYTHGIEYIQTEDYNVSPRNMGKPSIRKGTPCVCYEYPPESYTLIK